MLKKFIMKNFKNFEDEISINFQDTAGYQFNMDCISRDMISKMLIYGRNATGKTNLGKALMDIRGTLFGRPASLQEGFFLNADSPDDAAAFSYAFQFDEHELIYRYELFSDMHLKKEELVIDERLIYQFDFFKKAYNFDNLVYVGAETANTERYLESLEKGEMAEEIEGRGLPFFRWLINNVALKSDSLLLRLADYIQKMEMITLKDDAVSKKRGKYERFLERLEDAAELSDFEEFLNMMGIKCKLILKELPDGQRELYFEHGRLLPFYENASSGTRALTALYRGFIAVAKKTSFLYLDEFDAFYHYEMADNVIKFLKNKYSECQIIMTSHNTNLMTNRLMRPDCLFILSEKGKLTALCNATLRELREGHNLEKMYISGEFARYE